MRITDIINEDDGYYKPHDTSPRRGKALRGFPGPRGTGQSDGGTPKQLRKNPNTGKVWYKSERPPRHGIRKPMNVVPPNYGTMPGDPEGRQGTRVTSGAAKAIQQRVNVGATQPKTLWQKLLNIKFAPGQKRPNWSYGSRSGAGGGDVLNLNPKLKRSPGATRPKV